MSYSCIVKGLKGLLTTFYCITPSVHAKNKVPKSLHIPTANAASSNNKVDNEKGYAKFYSEKTKRCIN
jgi:hypothetical protein